MSGMLARRGLDTMALLIERPVREKPTTDPISPRCQPTYQDSSETRVL